MTYVLKYCADNIFFRLLPEKQVLDPSQWPVFAVINKVVPRARVAIQHSLGLDMLSSVWTTALALEGIVSVTLCAWLELKELPQAIKTEMTFHIFSTVHNA